MPEHLLDGALAHAAAFLGLAALAAAIDRADATGRTLARAAAALLAAAAALLLAGATLAFADDPDPTAALGVIAGTTWGRSWAVFALASLLALLLRRRPLAARAAIALALLGTVWLGHAATHGDLSPRVWLHLAHVGALLGWVGGLLALALDLGAGAAARASLARFSRRALPLVAIAVASGVALAATYALPGDPRAGAAWLAALLLKLALVAGALALALRNRARVARFTDRDAALERGVEAELLLVLAAIGLAGLLSQLPPP